MFSLKGCETICESMDVFPTQKRDLVVLQLREYIKKRPVHIGLRVNIVVKVILTTNQCCGWQKFPKKHKKGGLFPIQEDHVDHCFKDSKNSHRSHQKRDFPRPFMRSKSFFSTFYWNRIKEKTKYAMDPRIHFLMKPLNKRS